MELEGNRPGRGAQVGGGSAWNTAHYMYDFSTRNIPFYNYTSIHQSPMNWAQITCDFQINSKIDWLGLVNIVHMWKKFINLC